MTEMTEQSRFNDSPSEEELIFVLPWTCSLQVGKRVGALAAEGGGGSKQQQGRGRRKQQAAASKQQAAAGCLDWNWKGGRRE
jgi:hypothetical protein